MHWSRAAGNSQDPRSVVLSECWEAEPVALKSPAAAGVSLTGTSPASPVKPAGLGSPALRKQASTFVTYLSLGVLSVSLPL